MKKKAFTLIELLVVISIIAMLMAIMMPALAKVRRIAKQTICGTRIKQNIYGATLVANDNNGRLPKGGFQFGNINFDDAISFRAEEFLNLCEYTVGIGGSINTNVNMDPREMAPIAERVLTSKARNNFVCPELEKQEYDLGGTNIIRGVTKSTMPYIARYGGAGWNTRIGYCYLGGFDSDKWNWDNYPELAEEWRSPMTIADSGDSPLVTDRYRYIPKFSALVVVHGKNGPEQYVENDPDPRDVMKEYSSAKCNVGRLDGSVINKGLANLKPHHVTMDNNDVWSYTGPDYYFW
jgi:prepilin-type N-terminal cleavage/methylation domain-containing protein